MYIRVESYEDNFFTKVSFLCIVYIFMSISIDKSTKQNIKCKVFRFKIRTYLKMFLCLRICLCLLLRNENYLNIFYVSKRENISFSSIFRNFLNKFRPFFFELNSVFVLGACFSNSSHIIV